jgi:hypothetical protein
LLDHGEAGVPNVRVQLLSEGDHVLSSAVTSSTGRFAFDGLAAGPYRLQFSAPNAGLVFTSQRSGTNSAVDSDANAEGLTQPVVLGEDNPADTTIDAGLTDPANLSAQPVTPGPTLVPVDTELSSTGGVALPIPIAGLALVASGISCLLAGRRGP